MALAYIDSFSGLVPCRALAMYEHKEPGTMYAVTYCKVKITADRGAYRRGQYLDVTARIVVPRESVYRRNGQYFVAPYRWRDIAPNLFPKES